MREGNETFSLRQKSNFFIHTDKLAKYFPGVIKSFSSSYLKKNLTFKFTYLIKCADLDDLD